MQPLRLYLLGVPQLEAAGQEIRIKRRKAAALAAYLALNPQPQSRETLAALFWPEGDHEQARAALRSTLSSLTKLTDHQWIEANRLTLRIVPEAIWVDVVRFRTALRDVSAHDHDGDGLCDRCVQAYAEASQLYRADFLNGFYLNDSPEFEEWQLQQREWLQREYVDVQRRLTRHYAAHQRYDLALGHGQAWLNCDPLQESAHRHLMRLYAANGQRAEVQRQYQQCVELLDEAFVTPPEPKTTELYERLMQSASPVVPPEVGGKGAGVAVIPPLPSLMVGREQALADIKKRLGLDTDAVCPFTVIHGWPGVGKSTIAAMIAHDAQIAAHFSNGILWASLGESPDLLSELAGWASALNLRDASQVRKIDDLSVQLANAIRDKHLLLVIDDVWQVEHVKHFRIGGQNSVTVITSRLFDLSLALAPTAADVYRLPVLTEEASLELLRKLTPETVVEYPEEARQLVHDLEGLPLAIHVAGRLLHAESAMGWGIRELLSELRMGTELLAAQPPSDVLVVGRDASPSVAALLHRSTNRLSPMRRRQFALLGLFMPKPATFDLRAMGVAWDIDDPRSVVRDLVNHGLLEPINGGRFQMHALLVLHARSLLQTEPGE